MSESKHTEGPWMEEKRVDSDNEFLIKSNDKILGIIGYFHNIKIEESEANARLMAASPDMVKLLNKCEFYLEEYITNNYETASQNLIDLSEGLKLFLTKIEGDKK